MRSQLSPALGQPTLVLGGDPPTLTFGLYKGGNAVDARLTINAKGDVTATGIIKGALIPGEIRVQSGTVTDGVIIPLPPDISEDQVARSAVILHLHLTPHTPQTTNPGSGYVPIECRVDADRRLHCLVQVTVFESSVQQPGAADYLMVATVGSTAGANR